MQLLHLRRRESYARVRDALDNAAVAAVDTRAGSTHTFFELTADGRVWGCREHLDAVVVPDESHPIFRVIVGFDGAQETVIPYFAPSRSNSDCRFAADKTPLHASIVPRLP